MTRRRRVMPKKRCGFSSNGFVSRGAAVSIAAITLGFMACASAVGAAVVETWTHRIDVGPSTVTETSHWVVLMEDVDDVTAWSEFPIHLDENRELVSSDAWVVSPDGKRRKLKRKERDVRDVTASFELASSRRYMVFEPKDLAAGSRLEVKATVREAVYYPGAVLHLRPALDPFQKVEVEVRRQPGVEGFRRLLHGPLQDEPAEGEAAESSSGLEVSGLQVSGLQVTETASGFRLTGAWDRTPIRPRLAASSEVEPMLYLAWNTPDSWDGVARWYRELIAGLPRGSASLDAQAGELLAGLPTADDRAAARRAQLEALVDFVRRKVRYVAVEVGIGGYRPTPSPETLERKWGDCKDKSFLLIDLLKKAGIEAHPALIRLDDDGRIRDDFPSPFGFNHLIAAVKVDGLALEDGDPVAGGYLFIDPTQTVGSARYLHRSVQDQHALVVTDGEGVLVRTPVSPETQHIALEADLTVDEAGAASGTATLKFVGDYGAQFAQGMDARQPEDIEQQVRDLLQRLIPSVQASSVEWRGETDGLPFFEAQADIAVGSFVSGLARGGSVKLDGFQWAPAPRDIDELGEWPVSLPVSTVHNHYRLTLPDGMCPPKNRNDEVSNGAGVFQHRVSHEGNVVDIVRRTRPARSWFGATDLADLKALSTAEHRAVKRRIRFRCP